MLEAEARSAIRAAFPTLPRPDAADLCNDHCPECRETAARLADLRWDEVTVATLTNPHRVSIALLTASAFRYHLPALMILCLDAHPALDEIPMSVVGRLSPPNGKVPANDVASFASLTAAQCGAILAFLRCCEERAIAETSVPIGKPLPRAIRYWAARVSG